MQRVSVPNILIAALLAIGVSTATLTGAAADTPGNAEPAPASYGWTQQ